MARPPRPGPAGPRRPGLETFQKFLFSKNIGPSQLVIRTLRYLMRRALPVSLRSRMKGKMWMAPVVSTTGWSGRRKTSSFKCVRGCSSSWSMSSCPPRLWARLRAAPVVQAAAAVAAAATDFASAAVLAGGVPARRVASARGAAVLAGGVPARRCRRRRRLREVHP